MYKPVPPPSPKPRHSRSVTFDLDPPRSSASSRAASTTDLRVREPRRMSPTEGAEPAGYDGVYDSETDEMGERRPPYHRPVDGRSGEPLLYKPDDDRGRSRDSPKISPVHHTFNRRSTMRSRSPSAAAQAMLDTKKKYTYAAFFLGLSLVSFVIQTETAVYIQHELGWNKAYCMLYVSSPYPSYTLPSDDY